jgi:hypothetical protein
MSSIFEQFHCLTGKTPALPFPSRRLASRQTVRAVVILSVHLD